MCRLVPAGPHRPAACGNDFANEVIVWPGEFDKQRKEHVTPLSREARTTLVDLHWRQRNSPE